MGSYLIKRLLLTIPVLVAISILVFGGIRVIPGDICAIVLGVDTSGGDTGFQDQCPRVEEELGVSQPVVEQYFTWVGNVLQGDFGNSFTNRAPIVDLIRDRLPATIELTILSSIFAIAIAIPIGVLSALKQDKWPDILGRITTIGWLSMPSFWVGSMLITFPAKWWGYATPVPFEQFYNDPVTNVQQMYLPTIALGLALSAGLARITRSSMLEILRMDYVRTARAKGLEERTVLTRHALKNAMLPVITLIGLQTGFLLSGAVVVEQLFALPGLGSLLVTSVITKDFPQIQGLVLFFALLIVLINILVDLSYAFFDPRVRLS